MNLSILFRGCVIAILAGALFKLNHWPGADWLMLLGLAAVLVLVVAALVEIVRSRRVSGREKVLWMTAVLFGNIVGVILYIFVGRQRVLTGR